ncbi:Uncharacterised protein [Chromobacterium violaceum]|uniref:Uncharacterized protein n=1 Tax=Chromobacterium violaceum TaxID=536 RepID=A0A3S4HN60_CHRVL|nr:Uncharacterised protein [Chromobacterium violaceum]
MLPAAAELSMIALPVVCLACALSLVSSIASCSAWLLAVRSSVLLPSAASCCLASFELLDCRLILSPAMPSATLAAAFGCALSSATSGLAAPFCGFRPTCFRPSASAASLTVFWRLSVA